MEGELKNFIQVCVVAIASLTYCYFVSYNLPKGKTRLFSILPIILLFTLLPLNLTTITLTGSIGFFLQLANFKLILFAFGHQPLSSSPPIPLSLFISIAVLPIKISIKNQQHPSGHNATQNMKSSNGYVQEKIRFSKQEDPHDQNAQKMKSSNGNTQENIRFNKQDPYDQNTPKVKFSSGNQDIRFSNQDPSRKKSTKNPVLNLILKATLLAILWVVYKNKQHLNKNIMLAYYCCYLYISTEFVLAIGAFTAWSLLGLELEPHFNEPYLSTSLQDFWGRRWNLVMSNVLRSTIYNPVKFFCSRAFGRNNIDFASVTAVLATFLVSGLLHELIFFYFGRLKPSWEVTCFFVVQGFCVAVEILVKKKAKWRLNRVVSGVMTVVFVMVTAVWLFFPPVLRCGVVVRTEGEVSAVVEFLKSVGIGVLGFRKFLVH